MPLPAYIQNHLRQYDNSEMDWGEANNSHLMDNLALDVRSHNDVLYVLSRQFSTDMRYERVRFENVYFSAIADVSSPIARKNV